MHQILILSAYQYKTCLIRLAYKEADWLGIETFVQITCHKVSKICSPCVYKVHTVCILMTVWTTWSFQSRFLSLQGNTSTDCIIHVCPITTFLLIQLCIRLSIRAYYSVLTGSLQWKYFSEHIWWNEKYISDLSKISYYN